MATAHYFYTPTSTGAPKIGLPLKYNTLTLKKTDGDTGFVRILDRHAFSHESQAITMAPCGGISYFDDMFRNINKIFIKLFKKQSLLCCH